MTREARRRESSQGQDWRPPVIYTWLLCAYSRSTDHKERQGHKARTKVVELEHHVTHIRHTYWVLRIV